jgi:1,4-alpha-glucan branching enzyme
MLIPLLLAAGCAMLTPVQRPDLSETFSFWCPGACQVQVLGDWNGWGGLVEAGGTVSPEVGEMRSSGDGYWVLSVDLPRGRYRYAFLVDGVDMVADPMNPERARFGDLAVSLIVVE